MLLVEQKLLTISDHLGSHLGFCGFRVVQSSFFCVVFCRSIFVRLPFWPLYCLSFDLRLQITPLVSSNLLIESADTCTLNTYNVFIYFYKVCNYYYFIYFYYSNNYCGGCNAMWYCNGKLVDCFQK